MNQSKINLSDVPNIPVGKLSALPPEQLLILQEQAVQHFQKAKMLKEWLDNSIAFKYRNITAMKRLTKRIPVIDISKNSLSSNQLKHIKQELKDIFFSRVVINVNEKGCWHLMQVFKPKPSQFIWHWHYVNGELKKTCFMARRISFEYSKGEVPKELSVYCNCGNKYCVNPDHLYSFSIKDFSKKLRAEGLLKSRSGFKHTPETIAKMSQSQKGKKPNKKARLKMRLAKLGVSTRSPETIERCAELYYRGEKNATAKLTNEQVLEIRRLEKFRTCHDLAAIYPVTARHIRAIWRRRGWKHI